MAVESTQLNQWRACFVGQLNDSGPTEFSNLNLERKISTKWAEGWRRELTTRSLDALGFSQNMPRSPNEDQIIVAIVDSGIWPESTSFDDKDLGPPPAKWKGVCETGNSSIMPFKCNNKIIGARAYFPDDADIFPNEDKSPRDTTGHGTHVAAIVAGVPVENVSMGGTGLGLGTSRGVVPRARLAVYKVCWTKWSCGYMSYGVTDAIADGADIITMSVGTWPWPFGTDGQSYATFAAAQHGIFVALAGGNTNSLQPFTANNVMPWVTSVGNSAGSGTDYVTYVTLGDGKRFEGGFLNLVDDGQNMYPLILNEEVSNATDPEMLRVCIPRFMNPELVKGKIIICNEAIGKSRWPLYDALDIAGLVTNGEGAYYEFSREDYELTNQKTPVVVMKEAGFLHMLEYYKNSKKTGQIATAKLEKTVPSPDTVPRVALTSCRGPNLMDLNILKPDVSAPGVNIISADLGSSSYDSRTGSSMSAPLLSGVAAYIKSFHPTWSPAAIKSALMTTATPMTDPYFDAHELAYGAGQIDPVRANDPGLVYDINPTDYIKYLCQWSNSSKDMLYNVTRNSSNDCATLRIHKRWQLNYPSIAVPAFAGTPFVKVFQRFVTNVGNSSVSNYKAVVSAPESITVTVQPSVLAFTRVGQSLSFTVTVKGVLPKRRVKTRVLSAYLVWTDGYHQVRSPIVIFGRPYDMKAQAKKLLGTVPDPYYQT